MAIDGKHFQSYKEVHCMRECMHVRYIWNVASRAIHAPSHLSYSNMYTRAQSGATKVGHQSIHSELIHFPKPGTTTSINFPITRLGAAAAVLVVIVACETA
jgi:hypothetical protein